MVFLDFGAVYALVVFGDDVVLPAIVVGVLLEGLLVAEVWFDRFKGFFGLFEVLFGLVQVLVDLFEILRCDVSCDSA